MTDIADTGIGIVGFGRIGAEHAAWIDAAGARVACVADPTHARRARAAAAGIATASSIDDLLRRDDLSVVLVSTPTSMHFEHAMAAISAGKHVMVEKPVTLNLSQARQLAGEAARRGRTVGVFHNRRWDRDYLTVKAAIDSGAVGRVINVESRLGQWSSCVGPAAREYRPNWRNERAFGGGGLFDWGSHFADQLWRLMRPARPARVFAQLRGNVWSTDCDDFARVLIDFDNGAVGLVEINTTTTRPLPRWHIDGTNGSVDSPHSPTFDIDTWAALTHTAPDGTQRRIQLAPAGLDEPTIWQRFLAACRAGSDPPVTLTSTLPTMLLLDAARESAQTGSVVSLDASDIDWTA